METASACRPNIPWSPPLLSPLSNPPSGTRECCQRGVQQLTFDSSIAAIANYEKREWTLFMTLSVSAYVSYWSPSHFILELIRCRKSCADAKK
ncbi:hypothetical protein NPIL_216241 [Nephila pilipes]|uniref:Uncharacterized protein n=1 Tax=Nephila pilipes TaxID=299642 RepID=A0A8X6TFY2_NEPPI|nr:hypothetical protein NPIL_216241 [Nephila pilipes]